jgi:hypothetical protein
MKRKEVLMTSEEYKNQYIKTISSQTDIPETECLELLREKFKIFREAESAKYSRYLFDIANQRFEEEVVKKTEVMTHCPFHPESLISGSLKWYSPYTRVHGWSCAFGGNRCYIRWKMDEMLRFKGSNPIDWEYFDEHKEEILRHKIEEVTDV